MIAKRFMRSIFALVISLNVVVRISTSWNYIFQDWLILFFPPFLKIPFSGFVATHGDGRAEPNVTGIMLRIKMK